MKHKCDGCRYKSEHQEMGFASMGVCTRTTNLIEASQNYRAEKCPYKKTNYDRIKAMSVEEMAKFLCSCSKCEDGSCKGYDYCRIGHNGYSEWLNDQSKDESEVEE